jgi:hypothetical protein
MLTQQMELFCQNYATSNNATSAAKAAGYKDAHAANQGHRLLKRDDVQERIKDFQGIITTDIDVVAELERQYETSRLAGHGNVSLKALELLGKARGNKAEAETKDPVVLELEIVRCIQVLGLDKIMELIVIAFPEVSNEEDIEEDVVEDNDEDIEEEIEDYEFGCDE